MEKESAEHVEGVETNIQNSLQQYDRGLIVVEGRKPDLTKLMTTQSSLGNESLKKFEEKLVAFVEEKNKHKKKTLETQLQEMCTAVLDCMKRRDSSQVYILNILSNAWSYLDRIIWRNVQNI